MDPTFIKCAEQIRDVYDKKKHFVLIVWNHDTGLADIGHNLPNDKKLLTRLIQTCEDMLADLEEYGELTSFGPAPQSEPPI